MSLLKLTWRLLGTILYFVAWPFWMVYFRIWNKRTRGIIISDNKLLLVKGWLGKGSWSLPGGGAKKSESLEQSLIREVLEETNIDISKFMVKKLGQQQAGRATVRYQAYIYTANIDKSLNPSPQFPEILETKWVNFDQLSNYHLDKDTKRFIDSYLPEFKQ